MFVIIIIYFTSKFTMLSKFMTFCLNCRIDLNELKSSTLRNRFFSVFIQSLFKRLIKTIKLKLNILLCSFVLTIVNVFDDAKLALFIYLKNVKKLIDLRSDKIFLHFLLCDDFQFFFVFFF